MMAKKTEIRENLKKTAITKFVRNRESPEDVRWTLIRANISYDWGFVVSEIVSIVDEAYEEAVKKLNKKEK